MKRRFFFKTAISGVAVIGVNGLGTAFGNHLGRKELMLPLKKPQGDLRIRGPFPILSTPYLESGSVDYEVLAKEAKFISRCGTPAMIWPQSGDSCDLLTLEEKLNGMEAIAKNMVGAKSTVAFGCQGKNTEEMVVTAKHIENLAAKYDAPIAIISRPPDNGKTEADLKNYYLELEKHVNRPVIIQTSGGTTYKGPGPSVDLLVELARHNPDVFGYIKEESGNINERMALQVAAKPVIHTVFSAWGGWQWLYQSRQIGTEGLITERPAYADLLKTIWDQMENGDANGTLDDAFSKLLLMLNVKEFLTGEDQDERASHLYILQKRGVFKNRLLRMYERKNGKHIIPDRMILENQELSQMQIDEIESRFASLKQYLRT